MSDVSLVCVATFDDPVFAHVARSRLESEGIRATLDGEHHVAMDWLIANAVGGVKLLVKGSDQESAKSILDEKPSEMPENFRIDTSRPDGVGICPSCGSMDTFRERLKRKWIFLSLLFLGVPIPFISKKLVCDSCDHKWDRQNNLA